MPVFFLPNLLQTMAIQSIESPYLFSLAGQNEKERDTNYVIFVAL